MDALKRQVLPTGLWVVATPIGNLGDLSPRALQALSLADAILCEDTRRTSQLLAAVGLSGKRLERLDAHATPARLDQVADRLEAGENLALVSDAGTPAVSDPGSALVARALERGVRVTPLPGPSAVVTLLSVAGFESTAFLFRGFFPRKTKERETEIRLAESCAKLGATRVLAWFESPERVSDALAAWARLAPDARIIAGKELTKLHERFFSGNSVETAEKVASEIERDGALGEWCFAVEFAEHSSVNVENVAQDGDSLDWVKALQCLLNAQVSASGAAKQVSQHFGVSRNVAYDRALRLAGKKMNEGG
jgi:16S rRNA (cytidine1402-2'-O)-methyltransferase